jgi:hypothetical protein
LQQEAPVKLIVDLLKRRDVVKLARLCKEGTNVLVVEKSFVLDKFLKKPLEFTFA